METRILNAGGHALEIENGAAHIFCALKSLILILKCCPSNLCHCAAPLRKLIVQCFWRSRAGGKTGHAVVDVDAVPCHLICDRARRLIQPCLQAVPMQKTGRCSFFVADEIRDWRKNRFGYLAVDRSEYGRQVDLFAAGTASSALFGCKWAVLFRDLRARNRHMLASLFQLLV